MKTADIRLALANRYVIGDFVTDKTGVKTVEIVGASFVADEDHIFGEVNTDYVERETKWYDSESLNVNDIPPPIPAIWKAVATPDGHINSNYGWMVYSEENGAQFYNVLQELRKNPDSRRATMIYQRPSMWYEYNKDGMSDFCCTYAHQYLIRNDALHSVVFMRSNDAWAGYRNDLAWAKTVQTRLCEGLRADRPDLIVGPIHWNAASLHVYSSQFYLVDHYIKTGETHITKKKYQELYPESNLS